ncbi:MAG: TetR/AcrR family transcriptional regulator [Suilimivivens sp.]
MSFEAFEKLPEERKQLILSTGIKEFSEKSYKDASTDHITKECGISKGILFHYFRSKKEFYLYCLNVAMESLISQTKETENKSDFYDILFSSMERKISLCMRYSDEMHMVNMASRDASAEIAEGKAGILHKYMDLVQAESKTTLMRALAALEFKESENMEKTMEGLFLYIHAVLNKYLFQYQQAPDEFFQNSDRIKAEIKEYLDLMLFGICRK